MPLPSNPVSGSHTLTNPGVDDRWTCPNCYHDITGQGDGDTITCPACRCTLKLTVEEQPVCRATCIDPDGDGGDE